jgi:hypothetical protein
MNVHCANWDCGRAIPFLGIFLSNFRFWFFAVQLAWHCGHGLKMGLHLGQVLKIGWLLWQSDVTYKQMSATHICKLTADI